MGEELIRINSSEFKNPTTEVVKSMTKYTKAILEHEMKVVSIHFDIKKFSLFALRWHVSLEFLKARTEENSKMLILLFPGQNVF